MDCLPVKGIGKRSLCALFSQRNLWVFPFDSILPVSLEKVDKVFKIFFFTNKLAIGNSSTKLDKIVWVR